MEKTTEEKWELLEGLALHGADVDALSMTCKRWSKPELVMAIKRYRTRAEKKQNEDPNKNSNIKQWLDFTDDLQYLQGATNKTLRGYKQFSNSKKAPSDHAPVLSKMMKYAACFEEHPESSGPDDPDYKEIYTYLSQILIGAEPAHLQPGSAAKILEMLNKIKELTNEASVHPHLKHLQGLSINLANYSENETQGQKVHVKDSFVPECPLFEDHDESLVSVKLEPKDPYYEVKKEKVVRKWEALQQEAGTKLQTIPGLNPLEMSTEMMVNPTLASNQC